MSLSKSGGDAQLLVLDICEKVITLEISPQNAIAKLKDFIFALSDNFPAVTISSPRFLVYVEGDAQNSEIKDKAVAKFTEFVGLVADKIVPADILKIELGVLEASVPTNKQQLVWLKTRL
ncbi:unnamed protein product [Cylicostephanus goldi]|uniref:Uncharacterized protein n=1 Tax=Cylicostephanus goldi TaxID=71465 RepID=A0A3P7N7A0_CYLGO|nr:unnamed protein product [Cylicostephanus goldi]